MAVLLCFETGSPDLELTVRGCATTPSPWLTHDAKCIQSNFHRLSSLNSPNIVQKSKDTSGWWSPQPWEEELHQTSPPSISFLSQPHAP